MTDQAASLLVRNIPHTFFIGQKSSPVLFLIGIDSSQLRLILNLIFTQFTAFLHCPHLALHFVFILVNILVFISCVCSSYG